MGAGLFCVPPQYATGCSALRKTYKARKTKYKALKANLKALETF